MLDYSNAQMREYDEKSLYRIKYQDTQRQPTATDISFLRISNFDMPDLCGQCKCTEQATNR